MSRRCSLSLTHEGIYYLIVLAFIGGGALLREINLLLVLAGMMVSLMFLSVLLAVLNLRKLKVVRQLPRHAVAGERFQAKVGLENGAKQPRWAIAVRDTLCGEEGSAVWQPATSVEVFFTHSPAEDKVTRTYEGKLPFPGRYRLGPATLSTGFPIGLVRARLRLEGTDELFVVPRLGRINPVWLRELTARQGLGERSRAQRSRSGGDFYGLRDWQPGDSRRWIHWRASARYGRLTVREFEQPESRDLVLVVVPASFIADPQRGMEAHLRTLSFAATLLHYWTAGGNAKIVLATAGKEPRVRQGRASAGLQGEFLEQLAVLPPGESPSLADVLEQAYRAHGTDTSIVLVSGRALNLRTEPTLARLWNDPAWKRKMELLTFVDLASPTWNSVFAFDFQTPARNVREAAQAVT